MDRSLLCCVVTVPRLITIPLATSSRTWSRYIFRFLHSIQTTSGAPGASGEPPLSCSRSVSSKASARALALIMLLRRPLLKASTSSPTELNLHEGRTGITAIRPIIIPIFQLRTPVGLCRTLALCIDHKGLSSGCLPPRRRRFPPWAQLGGIFRHHWLASPEAPAIDVGPMHLITVE